MGLNTFLYYTCQLSSLFMNRSISCQPVALCGVCSEISHLNAQKFLTGGTLDCHLLCTYSQSQDKDMTNYSFYNDLLRQVTISDE